MAAFVKIAHRGASGNFPENTRLAFEKAIEARADMIEIDCQTTSDGHVVVFHDERLNRTAGVSGTVKSKTLQQLKKLDVGQWKKRSFRGEGVLTLEEVLEIIAGKVDLCLDIKQYNASQPGMEIKLLFIVSHYDYLDQTIFSSFDYPCLERIRELAPEARIGVIYGAGVKADPFVAAERLEASSMHVQRQMATRPFLDKAWETGLDVHVWTVNEVRDMEKFASLGVQGIVSDYPEKLSQLKSMTR
ncbi:MAG TPA: glycerophosphodiester phosphodiesterase family protein [Candidatus Binatia bacterium]|jgi:glycerophosphoryl diester phosphodiesterase|nr:glycerophosphodiester phosphodiesterase family protein [Candidatus Binatia bacterium]